MITLRTDLTRIQRTNLETCITVHMHQKESTEDLLRKKVRGFDWHRRQPLQLCAAKEVPQPDHSGHYDATRGKSGKPRTGENGMMTLLVFIQCRSETQPTSSG